MVRKWHYLKTNMNSETLYRCIFVDTETDEVAISETEHGHKLRFGWACATRRDPRGGWTSPSWKRFIEISDFWLWAMSHTSPGHKTWIWCHNASFDYPVLDAFCHLIDIGWKLESAIIDAPPTVVRYSSGRKSLVLADTLNIWRMSLAQLGIKCGLPKLEIPAKWGDKERDDEYCKRDVEIICKSVLDWADFLRSNDLGGFCPTIASQAMRTFRHKYLKDRILIEGSATSLGLARKCYHGGRCEAGFIGHLSQPVHSVDVNSMYPYVMSYAEMPLRLVGIRSTLQVRDLPGMLRDYCLCAHVSIDTQKPAFAIVKHGKLCFPVGKFDAYLTSSELSYALSIDAIKEVHLCSSYEKGVPFRDFALDLYANKERASRTGLQFEADHWKKLLNSFYGKWGQNGRKLVEIGVCDRHRFETLPNIDAQTGKKTLRTYFGGIVYERADDGESLESHPAIAAHITAEARMVLWTLIRKLAPEDYFYCDTDGLLVSEPGLNALTDHIDQFKLGGLKHVETFNDVWIYGCKDLILDGKQKTKGISKSAECLNEGSYRQLRWHSLKGLLRSSSLNMPLTTVVTKSLRRTYTKGIVTPSGFVVPLHLEEGSI